MPSDKLLPGSYVMVVDGVAYAARVEERFDGPYPCHTTSQYVVMPGRFPIKVSEVLERGYGLYPYHAF